MKPKTFAGIFPYLVSPIDESTGEILESVLRDLMEHLIARGVHGLSPLGSTGEVAYLSFEQRLRVVQIAVQVAKGRVPVVPGIAAYSTAAAVKQAKAFFEAGADGLVVMLQVMFPLTRGGIEGYFRSVAESVPCPIVLYTNPGLFGTDLSPDIVESLCHIPNVLYLKDASGNTGRILSVLNRVGDRMSIFSASAHVPLFVFQLGGVGWMSGPACALPTECVRLYELAQQGNWGDAMILQKSLWRLNELFQKYSLARCIKAALEIQGFAVGGPISPQEPLGSVAFDEIRSALDLFKK